MKRELSFILAVSAMMVLGCSKFDQPRQYSRASGAEIIFGTASTDGSNTRAAYTDSVFNKYERITWSAGDEILIYCNEAKNGPSKSYIVTDTTISNYKNASNAGIHAKTKTTLEWGEAVDHFFTAVCPAPGTGIEGVEITTAKKVKCVLPEVQSNDGVTEKIVEHKGGNFIAKADHKCMYLTGYAKATGGITGGPVGLVFDPAFTAFEFTLTNGFTTAGKRMVIDSVGIKSTSDYLAGSYIVSVSGLSTTDTLKRSDIQMQTAGASKEARMKFTTPVSVAKDSSITFTLFAQPAGNVDSLTFWFKDNLGCRRSFEFRYNDESHGNPWVSFFAFHKAKISGLIAPEGASWYIDMVPLLTAWNSDNQDLDMEGGLSLSFLTPAVIDWENGENGEIKVK